MAENKKRRTPIWRARSGGGGGVQTRRYRGRGHLVARFGRGFRLMTLLVTVLGTVVIGVAVVAPRAGASGSGPFV